ncbi:hypothetical protein PG991_009176 [Apiospora marii]|uniref:Uncharacterized protein n=1 Tax=Apiospora marii TaxID=335849 RepID=A0ABR1RKE8_9PEZI
MPRQRNNTYTDDIASSPAHPTTQTQTGKSPITKVNVQEPESFATLYARHLSNPLPPMNPMDAKSETDTDNSPSSYLYHVILKVIQLQNWHQTLDSAQYIIGTYATLPAANMAAGSALHKAGYEKNSFTTYVKTEPTEEHSGLIFAVTFDGAEFQIRVRRTPNTGLHVGVAGSQRIAGDIWHVLRTIISFSPHGERKHDLICGTFPSYESAKSQAHKVLLNGGEPSDGDDGKSAFVHYEEVETGDTDCPKSENIVVRAIGKDGTNYLVSLAKGYAMEGVRWVEAARRC